MSSVTPVSAASSMSTEPTSSSLITDSHFGCRRTTRTSSSTLSSCTLIGAHWYLLSVSVAVDGYSRTCYVQVLDNSAATLSLFYATARTGRFCVASDPIWTASRLASSAQSKCSSGFCVKRSSPAMVKTSSLPIRGQRSKSKAGTALMATKKGVSARSPWQIPTCSQNWTCSPPRNFPRTTSLLLMLPVPLTG